MINSFNDPLGMLMEQSMWAFRNSIVFAETVDEERFRLLHEHLEREINKYLEENGAPWERS